MNHPRPVTIINEILHYHCSRAACLRAGEWLPETEFGVLSAGSVCGRNSWCRVCKRAQAQEARQNPKPKPKAVPVHRVTEVEPKPRPRRERWELAHVPHSLRGFIETLGT